MLRYCSHSERLHSNTSAFNKNNVVFLLFIFPWPCPISHLLVLATNPNPKLLPHSI